MRALIYARVSEDPRGTGRSPEEQEAESRADCEREGWEIVEALQDNAISGSRYARKDRPQWKRVHELIASGEVDVLVTWAASRAQRDLDAYLELRKLCERHGVLWRYDGTTFDFSKRSDRFRTGIDALVAEDYAEQTRESVLRAIRANVRAGKPHGRRPFGYVRTYDPTTGALVTQEPHPVEAPIVREIFDRYLRGESMRTICSWLIESGVKTAQGNQWCPATVGTLLARPTYAGRLQHQGQVVGEGNWPALVDADTFDRVQARRNEAKTSQTRRSPQVRMLTGVARCGLCGARMHVIHDHKVRDVYTCSARYHVVRDLRKLESWVVGQVLERVDALRADGFLDTAPTADPDLKLRVAELRGRLDDAIVQFTAGHLSALTLARIEGEILPEISRLEAEARKQLVPIRLELPDDDLEAWWADVLTGEQRREVIRALVAGVVVKPVGRGHGRVAFDSSPSAVEIEWRW